MSDPRKQREELRLLAARATKLPWHWATSNSTRRLSNEQQDGKVAHGQVHPIDKTGDIAISDRDMEYSEAACNAVPQLLSDLEQAERERNELRELLTSANSLIRCNRCYNCEADFGKERECESDCDCRCHQVQKNIEAALTPQPTKG